MSGATPGKKPPSGAFNIDIVKRKARSQFAEEILRTPLQFLRSRPDHSNGRDFVPGCEKISPESGFESGDSKLVHAQCAKQWIASDAGDQIFFPGDDARLRPAQKFVTAEQHHGNACVNALLHRGFADAGFRNINEAAPTAG